MEFSPEARAEFDKIVARYPDGHKRAALIPVLFLAQSEFGFVSLEAMEYVARLLDLPPSKVLHVATFYTMFNKRPVGDYHLQVCKSISCALVNGYKLLEYLEEKLGIEVGESTSDGKFTLWEVECLAACGHAPVVQCNEDYHEDLGGPLDDGTWPQVDNLLESWGYDEEEYA